MTFAGGIHILAILAAAALSGLLLSAALVEWAACHTGKLEDAETKRRWREFKSRGGR